MKPKLTAREHYDRLAKMGNDINDPPDALSYMARWDGPPFWDAIGDPRGKDVLETGVGTGRLALQLLEKRCRSFTGLDISPLTIEAAGNRLNGFSNVRLILGDISEFRRPCGFDIAYSVLTFMHVQDKAKALENMVGSLRPGGKLVLSLDMASDTFDFGQWEVPLFPWEPELYIQTLESLGCDMSEPIPLVDRWRDSSGGVSDTFGKVIATLISAVRR